MNVRYATPKEKKGMEEVMQTLYSYSDFCDRICFERIEDEIIDVYTHPSPLVGDDGRKSIIKHLLSIRKDILDMMFGLNPESAKLLVEFNEKMKEALLDMRRRSMVIYKEMSERGDLGEALMIRSPSYILAIV